MLENSKGWSIEMQTATGPDVWTKIGQTTSLTLPKPEQQYEDGTDLDSTCVKDGEPVGLATPGSCSGQVLYSPTGIHITLANAAAEEDTEKRNFRVKRKSGVVHCTFPGTVKTFAPTVGVKQWVKADFEIKCSEPPVYGDDD